MSERPRDQFLDLPEGDPLSTEHLDEKVQQAEAQEQHLKRQLEVIERQKREFEELSRRQETFNVGKADVVDKLTRSLVVLERESHDATKRVEMLHSIYASFSQHLENMESISPKSWEGMDISKELTRALASLDDARVEFTKSYPKISVASERDHGPSANEGIYASDHSGGDSKDFISWLKIGLAFSLPLLVFGLIALVVIVSRIPGK